ncbi:hypothetical protein H8D85_01670 [bacterium]|nr:hypothetical protein [bacterium]
MKQQELNKLAATAIKALQSEKDKLSEQLEQKHRVEGIVSSLYKKGSLAAEDVFSTLTKLGEKSLKELEVIEQAIELQKQGSYSFDFGTISEDFQDDGTLDPITRLLLEDY